MTGESRLVSLVDLEAGENGIVEYIQGGYGLHGCLAALGIAVGKKITKVTPVLVQGPVSISVDDVQVSIGFGMASRVMVRIDV
ncbi:MAG: ferrous iron transport protein A [Deltaproteobacteria bacterium]|nr:ferrous iron transport protein A [Deltaproteobacteria bacterium]